MTEQAKAKIKKETTNTLRMRRDALDSHLQNCALAGVPASDEAVDEFAEIQAELEVRKAHFKSRTWTSILGTGLSGCKLEHLLSDGSFAYVIQGTTDSGEKKVFKVAKDPEDLPVSQPTAARPYPTLSFRQGETLEALPPCTNELIMAEVERLSKCKHSAVPLIEEVSLFGDRAYYKTSFLEGQSLRSLLKNSPDLPLTELLRIFLELTSMLDDISQKGLWSYHGDIKPDNIFISSEGIKLFDPGFFGQMKGADGVVGSFIISTPAYYPYLKPDDCLAVGISLWEMIVGSHPFAPNTGDTPSYAGADLLETINEADIFAQPYLLALVTLRPPRMDRAGITDALEQLLLRCLGLRFEDDGRLHLGEGFYSFMQMNQEIARVVAES